MKKESLKIIGIFLVLLLVTGVGQLFVFEGLIKDKQEKIINELKDEIQLVEKILMLNQRNIKSVNDIISLDKDNIESINIENIVYLIEPEMLNIKNKYYFLKMKDSTLGTLEKKEKDYILKLNEPIENITFEVNALTKEKIFITFDKTIELPQNSKYKKETIINKTYKNLIVTKEIKKTFSLKIHNNIIKNIHVVFSTYSLETKYIDKLMSLFSIFNIIYLLFITYITYLYIQKKRTSGNLISMETEETKPIRMLSKKDTFLNNCCQNGDVQIYTKGIEIENLSTGSKETLPVIDYMINNELLKNINQNKLESRYLNSLNKKIYEFALKENLFNKNIIFPVYYNNIRNEEFLNWLEYFIVTNNISDLKIYVLGITEVKNDFLSKLLIRFNNENISIVISKRSKSKLKEYINKVTYCEVV